MLQWLLGGQLTVKDADFDTFLSSSLSNTTSKPWSPGNGSLDLRRGRW